MPETKVIIPLQKKYYTGEQIHDVITTCVSDYGTVMAILKKFAEIPSAQPEPYGDAVSRKDVVKFLDDWTSVLDANCHHQSMADLKIIKNDFENLPSVTPKPEQRWIPAWQEYPQDNRFVLVCNDDGRCAVAQYIGHEVDAYHPWQIAYCPYDVDVWEDDEHGKIMAWMELPIPYKEKNNDERGSTSTFERLRSRILQGEQKPNTATQF